MKNYNSTNNQEANSSKGSRKRGVTKTGLIVFYILVWVITLLIWRFLCTPSDVLGFTIMFLVILLRSRHSQSPCSTGYSAPPFGILTVQRPFSKHSKKS